ncbi:MAG: hypothetical protein J1E65_06805 [Lachnospiraceae bacterium]|nr:hypothetical protein [Lachnospiraceae bacterium]
MSYCVNCGVELEPSLRECPLCNTPVINPRELEKAALSPYPKEKGQVEQVKRKDLAILLSVILAATGLTCGLLNLLVIRASAWSLLIVGGCMVIWMLFVPGIIYHKLSAYLALLLDGLAIGIYLYLITFVTGSDVWFYGLALPIVLWILFLAEISALCIKKLPQTILAAMLYFFSAVGILCLGLEIIIDWYLSEKIQLLWSAIVLTVCVILDITLITLLSRKRLRDEVDRRLHF